jgi:alpha-maltose-1-phosphate synthase
MKRVIMLLYKDILFDARVQREAIGLAEEGMEVTILCLKEYQTKPPYLHKNINIRRIEISSKKYKQKLLKDTKTKSSSTFKGKVLKRIVRFPIIKLLKDLYSYNEYYQKCREILNNKQQRWDIIHCHDLNTLQAGVKLAQEFQMKVIYDSHELFNEMTGRNKLDRWYGYKLEKRLLQYVDHLIVVNPFIVEVFKDKYQSLPKTTVIQNIPIYRKEVLSEIENNYFRIKYGLNKKDFLLIYQGGLDPYRGLEEILLAMKYLPNHFKLVLLGNGRIKKELQDLVQQENLSNRVFFHDTVPSNKILSYTKEADVGLVMYKNISQNNYFSTPNKIFEYLLAGIPTVASNHPGKSYIVRNDQTGICTDETPVKIAEAVMQIYKNYDFYKENCLKSRTKYSWDYEKKKLVRIYKSL